jgi:hypothetical protein
MLRTLGAASSRRGLHECLGRTSEWQGPSESEEWVESLSTGTPAALQAIKAAGQTADHFLKQHALGFWGEVDECDKAMNNQAQKVGARIMSAYKTAKGVDIWMITEAVGDSGKREATTILLPSEIDSPAKLTIHFTRGGLNHGNRIQNRSDRNWTGDRIQRSRNVQHGRRLWSPVVVEEHDVVGWEQHGDTSAALVVSEHRINVRCLRS